MLRCALVAVLVSVVGLAGAQGTGSLATKGKRGQLPAATARTIDPAKLQAATARMSAALASGKKSIGATKASPALKAWANNRSKQLQVVSLNGVSATIDPVRGVVMMEPDGTKAKSLAYAKSGLAPEEMTRRFVASQKGFFKLEDATHELVLTDAAADGAGMTHLTFQQSHAGIPFWGRELRAHLGPGGELKSLNGYVEPTPAATIPTTPAITAAEAEANAKAALEAEGHKFELDPETAGRIGIEPVAPVLNYWQAADGAPVELVYIVELRPNLVDWYRIFVNATDGSVRERYLATAQDGPATARAVDQLGQTVTLNTYKIGSNYHLLDTSRPMFVSGQSSTQLLNNPKGAIVTWDLQNKDLTSSAKIFSVTSSNNTWNDKGSVSPHDFGGQAYEYFRTKHGRNSIDGNGGTIISLIHVTKDGKGLDNAYWNGSAMIYGDGNTAFFPLSRGLDVATHEMTHGVIQNTANLEYKNQSGALNESMADVFGILVDSDDYRVGENVVKPEVFTSGALRDLQDPHNGVTQGRNGWQPRTMAEFQNMDATQDNGGVHMNSGIPNFAAYKVIAALGREKAGQIYYKALAFYLGKQSNFLDARLALERSAKELFGDNSAEYLAVSKAFADVGILPSGGTDGGTTTPPPDSPVNDGTQQVVVVGSDAKIYLTDPQFASFSRLTDTTVNLDSGRPMAITPDGELLLFVDGTYSLRGYTDHETILSESQLIDGVLVGWNSVSISPSGRYVALTSNMQEKLIYLLDLTGNRSTIVPLYRPTTGQGELQDVVKYADAMTWLDDVFLAYDNRNVIQTPGGTTRDFWDITIVDTSTAFVSPQPTLSYYPLLSAQDGIQVANPTVSTRNSSVLAFDLVDEANAAYSVWGADLYSGNAKKIQDNGSSFGFPDYSVDDLSLVYASMDGTTPVIKGINVAADGITATSAPGIAVRNGKRVLWFAVGQQLPQRDQILKFLTEKDASSGFVDTNGDRVLDAGDVGIPQ